MNQYIEKRLVAKDLPDEWNLLAENYFQKREFLSYTEKYNPCVQRYYCLYEHDKLLAAAIIYSLRLDLFTYLRIKSPLKMNIAGIPCSVSSSGIFGSKEHKEQLKNFIFINEKGFVLFLNLDEKPLHETNATGKTLPTILLKNTFKSWEEYLVHLRSDYRRRLQKITKTGSGTELIKTACSVFDEEMYRQYLQVYSKSTAKLEKLSFSFFKNLPPEFHLVACRKNGRTIGWNILLQSDRSLFFFLGGIDYQQNAENQTYLKLLTNIVAEGIVQGVDLIDLGQTAEIPKMRLGGQAQTKYMEARHSNSLFHRLLKFNEKSLEYKKEIFNHHVMKEINL
ncbi:MAG: GNAT family N-acetyltransferase [Bacteroidota bacterium]|nr:GNAT family N-acetyltransferase [Bacteroidota bacterium]